MKRKFVALVVLVAAMLMMTATALAGKIPMSVDEFDSSVTWEEWEPGAATFRYECNGEVDFEVNGESKHYFRAYYDESGCLLRYQVVFRCPAYEGDKGFDMVDLYINYNANHGFDEVYIVRTYISNKFGDRGKLISEAFDWISGTDSWVKKYGTDEIQQEEAFDPAEYWEQLGGFDPSDYEIYGSWTAAAPSAPEDPSTPTTDSATLDNAYGKLAIIDANGNLVDYTGFEMFEGAVFYFEHGLIRDDMEGLTLIGGTWYNMQQGRFNTADGMVFFEGATFLVKGGVIDETQSGLIEYDGQRFVFSYGQFVSALYGAWPDPISGRFVYIWAGQFYPITDLVSYDGQIFYFIDGYLATDFVGTVYDFNGTPFNVIYGQVY